MPKMKKAQTVDALARAIRRDMLKVIEKRLKQVKKNAAQIKSAKSRSSYERTADTYLDVARELRKTRNDKRNQTMLSQLKTGLLLTEHTLAMNLHGIDSPQARKASLALERELERQHEDEYRRSLEHD